MTDLIKSSLPLKWYKRDLNSAIELQPTEASVIYY